MALLPWQIDPWQHVVKQVQSGSLPHAYLFSGPEGIGKFEFALQFAKYLLCEKRCAKSLNSGGNLDDEACGQCKQCKLLNSETHPDLKVIQPDTDSAVLKINTIRALVEFFQQSSLQGGRKIAILSPAEALNKNAANALLKTLEEPTSGSIIILVSHSSGQLLPTIRSRCQVLDFKVPSIEPAIKWLTQQDYSLTECQYTQNDFEAVLHLASNAPLRAKHYLEINALAENNRMLDELACLLKREVVATTISERWSDDLSSLRLSWVIQWVVEIVKIKMLIQTPQHVVSTEKMHGGKMLHYLAERSSAEQLFGLYKDSLKEYKLFLGTSNPNKLLSFEYLLKGWSDLMLKT